MRRSPWPLIVIAALTCTVLAGVPARADVLRMRSGTEVDGEFLGLQRDHVRFRVGAAVMRVPRTDVVGVWDDAGAELFPARPPDARAGASAAAPAPALRTAPPPVAVPETSAPEPAVQDEPAPSLRRRFFRNPFARPAPPAPEAQPAERPDAASAEAQPEPAQATPEAPTEAERREAADLFAWGDRYAARGDHMMAVSAYRRGLSLDPHDADAHYRLGLIFDAQRNWGDAIAELEEAIRLDPTHEAAHLALGQAYVAAQEYGRAIAHFREAARLNPENPETHYRAGETFVQQGSYSLAVGPLEQAVHLSPDNAVYRAELGRALVGTGRLETGIAELRQALNLEPDNAAIGDALWQAMAEQDRQERAADEPPAESDAGPAPAPPAAPLPSEESVRVADAAQVRPWPDRAPAPEKDARPATPTPPEWVPAASETPESAPTPPAAAGAQTPASAPPASAPPEGGEALDDVAERLLVAYADWPAGGRAATSAKGREAAADDAGESAIMPMQPLEQVPWSEQAASRPADTEDGTVPGPAAPPRRLLAERRAAAPVLPSLAPEDPPLPPEEDRGPVSNLAVELHTPVAVVRRGLKATSALDVPPADRFEIVRAAVQFAELVLDRRLREWDGRVDGPYEHVCRALANAKRTWPEESYEEHAARLYRYLKRYARGCEVSEPVALDSALIATLDAVPEGVPNITPDEWYGALVVTAQCP